MVAITSKTKVKVRPIPINRAQQRALASTAWLTGFVGGRGAGKTKFGGIDIAMKSRAGDPCQCISPDANVIRETSFPSFLETVKYTGQYIDDVLSPVPKVTFRTWDNGVATLVFKGAEKPEKLRGPNKARLWFDEASIISLEAFQIGIGMCRWKGKVSPVTCTFTPRGLKHWSFERFYRKIEDSEVDLHIGRVVYFNDKPYVPRENTFLVHCRTADNPFVSSEYEGIIGQNYSAIMREQELAGLFVEISGLMFPRAKFNYVDSAPLDCTWIRYWDKASTPGDGCFSAGVLIGKDPRGRIYIQHVVRGQWSAGERNKIMMQTAEADFRRYNGRVLTYIEREGSGSGKEIVDQLIIAMGKYPVYADSCLVSNRLSGGVKLPGDAKVRRAFPFQAQVEAGNVYIVFGGDWIGDFLDEITMFPEYKFCDQVDAAAAGYNKLANMPTDNWQAERYTKPAEVGHYGRAVENGYGDFDLRNPLPWNQNQ